MAWGRLGILLGIWVLSASVHAQEGTAGLSVVEANPGTTRFSQWGVSFFSIGSLTQRQVETGGSSYGVNGYIGLNYKISSSQRISVRPVFNVNSAGVDKRGRQIEKGSSLGDGHLVYSNYEMAAIGAVEVSSSFKLYLPTSEFSSHIHQIAKFRPEAFISHRFGRFSGITYVIKPDFYIQSQTTFVDPDAKPRADGTYKYDPRRTTQLAGLEHYLELNANVNKYLSVKPQVGFKEDWYHSGGSDKLRGNHFTSAKVALGFDIRPVRKLTFTLIAENLVKLSHRRDDVKFFRPEDNNLVLMTNASL